MTKHLAKVIHAESPRAHPQGRAQRIVGEKSPPAHADAAGNDPVQLTQHGKETRDQHHLPAMALKERLHPGQAARGDPDTDAVADEQPPATKAPDRKADVVADDRGQAERLEQQRTEDRTVAVPIQIGRGQSDRVVQVMHRSRPGRSGWSRSSRCGAQRPW
jgi:hypothetical protein